MRRVWHGKIAAAGPHGDQAHSAVVGDLAEIGARSDASVGQLPHEAVPEEAVELLDRCDDFDRHAAAGAAASFRGARRRRVLWSIGRHVSDGAADHVRDRVETMQATEPRVHEHDVLGAAATKYFDAL